MIGLDRKLSRWTAAGLLDEEAANAIRAFEAGSGRPALLWAAGSLALLSLALGVALVVGANWDSIPASVKLAVHLAAMIAAGGLALYGTSRKSLWLSEAALFLLVALTIAGIALQGQVYQLTGPLWQPVALWTVLCAPVLFLLGHRWLNGLLPGIMAGALMLTLFMHAADIPEDRQPVFVGIAGAIPFLLLAASAVAPREGAVAESCRVLGLAYILLIASLAQFAWSSEISPAESLLALKALALPLLAMSGCLWILRNEPANVKPVLVTTAVVSFLATALAVLVPHETFWYWRLAGLILFAAMWGIIVWTAAAHGWRILYGIGVSIIAARLVLVYFELFGSLASTGLGLISGGVLALLLLAGWRVLRKRREASA